MPCLQYDIIVSCFISQPSIPRRGLDSHTCLSPVQETIDPQYKVTLAAEAHTSKRCRKRDSPPKDNNTVHRIVGSEKGNGSCLCDGGMNGSHVISMLF